jgi:3-hydroxy-9,10-secoandrosta-1,3,5(10)-triene-9,17-dione monooxygenase
MASSASHEVGDESLSLSCFLKQAHSIGEQAEQSALESERNRQANDRVVRSLIDSGLLKILHAKRFGGYESGLPEFVRVAQVLAQHDVSLSWVYCIIGVHYWWGAFVEPELQEELWGKNPDCVFVDSFAPTGQAEPEDGGFRLNGRWGFLSGLPWAEWSAVGAIAPFEVGGKPEYLMLFMPKDQYQVLDDWHTMGLRGSASASIEAHNAFVPRHRVFRFSQTIETGQAPGLAYNPGRLYRIPIVAGLGISLVPPSVGGAQAVAELFNRSARVRTPRYQQQRQAELVLSQTVFAESMLTLETIEQLLHRCADELTEVGRGERVLDGVQRVRMFACRAYIARRAREVVDNLVDIAGARSIFESEPIQRFWRDLHAMGQHVALNYEAGMRNYGRVLMGLDPDVTLY